MFEKFFIVQDIAKTLVKNDYKISFCSGCFDIAARKKEKFLLKVLVNIDAFSRGHSLSLKAISYFLSAIPIIISLKNGRDKLRDEVIYSRFDLDVLTPNTFKKMVNEEIYPSFSSRGKHVVKIFCEKLRERRKELNYSLNELSKLANISKKALYEIENGRVLPKEETAKRLEKILKTKLIVPFNPSEPKKVFIEPKEKVEKEISNKLFDLGIENTAVFFAPFNLIGKEKFPIITKSFEKIKEIKVDAERIEKLSSIFSSLTLYVAKREVKEKIEYPIISKNELLETFSSKELLEKIERKI